MKIFIYFCSLFPINSLSLESVSSGNYYALLIAAENYIDHGINQLENPVNDVVAVRKILERYNFSPNNIKTLTDPSRDEIIQAFENLTQRLGDNDNLLIFYAGHGFWDERLEQGYWLPSDASKSSKSRWLSNSTIRDYIRAIQTKHTLLISDACFSGGIFKTRNAFDEMSTAVERLYNLPSRKAMTSGVLELVPDDSIFVKYLISSLENNRKQYVSAEELFAKFKNQVINNSSLKQVPQFGEISDTGDKGGGFIFFRPDGEVYKVLESEIINDEQYNFDDDNRYSKSEGKKNTEVEQAAVVINQSTYGSQSPTPYSTSGPIIINYGN